MGLKYSLAYYKKLPNSITESQSNVFQFDIPPVSKDLPHPIYKFEFTFLEKSIHYTSVF